MPCCAPEIVSSCPHEMLARRGGLPLPGEERANGEPVISSEPLIIAAARSDRCVATVPPYCLPTIRPSEGLDLACPQ